jgi:hypothetical protein
LRSLTCGRSRTFRCTDGCPLYIMAYNLPLYAFYRACDNSRLEKSSSAALVIGIVEESPQISCSRRCDYLASRRLSSFPYAVTRTSQFVLFSFADSNVNVSCSIQAPACLLPHILKA